MDLSQVCKGTSEIVCFSKSFTNAKFMHNATSFGISEKVMRVSTYLSIVTRFSGLLYLPNCP